MRLGLSFLVSLTFLSCGMAEDEEEHKFISVKLGSKKKLDCDSEETEPISWTFKAEGQNNTIDLLPENDENFKQDGDELLIKEVEEEDLGIYSCFNAEKKQLKSFEVDISLKLKKMPKSISIDEGSSTGDDIKCSMVSSGQEVVFKWFSRPEDEDDATKKTPMCSKTEDMDCSIPDAQPLFEKKDKLAPVIPLAERSSIITGKNENDIPFSILTIKDTDLTDRMVFTCIVTLKESDLEEIVDCKEESKHCDMSETILRVKDPLAAVWPFCGIVVEVVLLCIIIFFCEKRKSSMEKDDYDEGSNGHNLAPSRQRK